MLKRFCVVVVFGIAFAYIEAAVVVYLRTIFHPNGFTFPLINFGINPLWKPLLVTEVGREAAALVLILTSSWLFGKNRHQRFAYFATIFAIWDIFYYVWLKVLIDWARLNYGLGHSISDTNALGWSCVGSSACFVYPAFVCSNSTLQRLLCWSA